MSGLVCETKPNSIDGYRKRCIDGQNMENVIRIRD